MGAPTKATRATSRGTNKESAGVSSQADPADDGSESGLIAALKKAGGGKPPPGLKTPVGKKGTELETAKGLKGGALTAGAPTAGASKTGASKTGASKPGASKPGASKPGALKPGVKVSTNVVKGVKQGEKGEGKKAKEDAEKRESTAEREEKKRAGVFVNN
jgi:hypothetical protein